MPTLGPSRAQPPKPTRTQFENGDELCAYMREQTGPTTLLAFSAGKDAIAAWLQLRKHFENVVPVYMYLVPGLKFVDRALAYYEDFFGTRIYQVPHPSMYRMLANFTFQPPERIQAIQRAKLVEYTYEHVWQKLRRALELPGVYVANGVRAVDSPLRWASVKKHGPISHTKQTFMPVYDWRKADLVREINLAGVQLPPDYRMFGRTFDGIDYRFVEPLSRYAPDDYQRLLKWFPLAELNLLRGQMARDKNR